MSRYKYLNQLRPANTTAASIFSGTEKDNYIARLLLVTNVSGATARFRVFYDINGTTYDQTTALYYDVETPAGGTYEIDFAGIGVPIESTSNNLAVRTDTADALNFTLYGDKL